MLTNQANLNEEEIGKIILNSAFKVHTTLGPGLLESVILKIDLKKPSRPSRSSREV